MGWRDGWIWQQPAPEPTRDQSLTLDQYIEFLFQGLLYQQGALSQTLNGQREDIGRNFTGLVRGAYKTNGVVFACMLVRMLLFSEMRPQFRRVRNGKPGDLFGTTALAALENPWPGANTGDLLARAIQDIDLAGNFFAVRRAQNRIKRLRPDWVTIVCGTSSSSDPAYDPDTEILGYLYTPGGPGSGEDPIPFDVTEVAHWAPIPDPEAQYRGMSWLNPVIQDVIGDKAMTEHKIRYFEGGGTPNLQITVPETVTTEEAFNKWVEKAKAAHSSLVNGTLFMGMGADAKVIGATFEQSELKETQGALETRIAAAAGVPPVIVGLSEGLDAATYSNYAQARRRLSDGTMRPLWRTFCGAMSQIVEVPGDAELWYDDRDIAFLQEDMKDASEIQGRESQTIRTLIDAGFNADSVIEAVSNNDWTRLVHSGLFSVQLQPPGPQEPTDPLNGDRALRELRELVERT